MDAFATYIDAPRCANTRSSSFYFYPQYDTTYRPSFVNATIQCTSLSIFVMSDTQDHHTDLEKTSTGAESTSNHGPHRSALEEFDHGDTRPPYLLTFTEVKLLGIAGVSLTFPIYLYLLTASHRLGFSWMVSLVRLQIVNSPPEPLRPQPTIFSSST